MSSSKGNLLGNCLGMETPFEPGKEEEEDEEVGNLRSDRDDNH